MKRLWAPKHEDDPTPPAVNAGLPPSPANTEVIGKKTVDESAGESPTFEPFSQFATLTPRARRLQARPATYSEAKPLDMRAALFFERPAARVPLRLVQATALAEQDAISSGVLQPPAGLQQAVNEEDQPALSPREILLRAARLKDSAADAPPQAKKPSVVSIDQARKKDQESEDDLWSSPSIEPLPTLAETAAQNGHGMPSGEAQPLRFADSGNAADNEAFADFGIPLRSEQPKKPRRPSRSLQAIEKILLSRRFTQALVASVALVFISNMDVPWRDWASERMQQVKEPVVRAMNAMSKPMRERAAFFVIEDFAAGVEAWTTPNGSMRSFDDGTMTVRGLALREDTMHRVSYRMDFDAKIQNRAVGWVVRANSSDTYYALKLVRSGAGHFLERYPVLDGQRGTNARRIELPQELASAGEFINVSSRVRDNQITTLVNGWGVDFWKDDTLDHGGVGFLAEGRETALVKDLRVSGNEDTWGLILYGTLETMRSVEEVFSSTTPATLLIAPVPVEMMRPFAPAPAR